MNIRITGAGAGTGKTHQLCEIIAEALGSAKCRPGGFIATTFTIKAASELTERVRARLLKDHQQDAALRVEESLIGTVHSVCVRILGRFAFDAGISPRLRVLDETLEGILLGGAIEECFSLTDIGDMERLCRRLGQTDARTSESKWRQQVRDVISSARSNAIHASDLEQMALQSVAELCSQLPAATSAELEAPLISAIKTAIAAISGNGDETKVTAGSLESLEQALSALRKRDFTWADWCRLAKLKAAKASQPHLAVVNQAASRVEEHPKLRADIETYTTRIFRLAADALEIYQDRKKARGMLDFTDLEVLTLDLLRRPHVRECLAEEYDLLVVDEFQDTSPIQLALFMELAGLVSETHWVGDTKQSIYGFRGCDPVLMQEAEKKFRTGDQPNTLSTSRRHRPELVDFFNGLFPDIFASTNGISRDEVELHAHRKGHPALSPAIELWSVSSHRTIKSGALAAINGSEFESCIVRGIQDLMDSGMKVGDKDLQTDGEEFPRPLRWRDIAVLCRSNTKASNIAARLQRCGIPAARRTEGLMSSPEAVLALACLRWLSDDRDSLAVAEILTLEESRDVEDWLENRLTWVAEQSKGQWGLDGDLSSPVLGRISHLRARMKMLTPSELLDAVMIHGDLSGIASQWDATRASTRRANLETLRGLAAEYEAGCLSASVAASHAGFLIWCGTLASSGKDHSALDQSADAVQVMTWHGSKGLEWPVVICLDLPEEPRPRIWNSPLAVSPPDFDPDNPLAGRRIRFWPYPFGAQGKDVPLKDVVETSDTGKRAFEDASAEQSRLHYVVMTRARDFLIFPLDGKKDPWLPPGVECPALQLPAPTTKEDTVDGVRRRFRHLTSGEDDSSLVAEPTVKWFAPPLTPKKFPPAELTPSGLPSLVNVAIGEDLVCGKPIRIAPGQNDRDLGNALHAILAAHLIDPAIPEFQTHAHDILEAYKINAEAAEITSATIAFREILIERFKPTEFLVEVPFTHRNAEGQRITGFIDIVLITDKGAVLIDHKSYPGSNLLERAVSYSGQLAAYREAMCAHGLTVSSSWIHFCTQGRLVEIR
ncbi:MAG: UvrD-helicase domain-containing protein [Haloferula sp.]